METVSPTKTLPMEFNELEDKLLKSPAGRGSCSRIAWSTYRTYCANGKSTLITTIAIYDHRPLSSFVILAKRNLLSLLGLAKGDSSTLLVSSA